MALFDAAQELKVEVKDPLWGLNQATNLDLFTGYRNVSWPVSNVFHDKFTLAPEVTHPFRILLNGVQDIGIQETESLILEGGYLSGKSESFFDEDF